LKKKDLTTSDQDGKGHPTDGLTKNQKRINIEQNRLVFFTGKLEGEKALLVRLKKEYEEAFFILQSYRTKLDRMQKTLGLLVMDYTVEGDFYTFSDGATFNKRTQDFTFAPDGHPTVFNVTHICFGAEVFTTKIDENFIHINRTINKKNEKYVYQRIIRDKDKFEPKSVSDSIQTMEIFSALLKDDVEINIKALAGGIIVESQDEFSRNNNESPTPFVEATKTNEGVTLYRATWESDLNLTVQVWEDKMIPFGFTEFEKGFSKFKTKNPELNEIDYCCGIRAIQSTQTWILSMMTKAEQWIEDSRDRATILKKLKKAKAKTVWFKEGVIEGKVPIIKMVNG